VVDKVLQHYGNVCKYSFFIAIKKRAMPAFLLPEKN